MQTYYIYIDESGDIGDPRKKGASLDFSMSACVCKKENILKISYLVHELVTGVNKREIKFSKSTKKEKTYILKHLNRLNLSIKSVYFKKNRFFYKDILEISFEELMKKINIDHTLPVKVIINGDENKFYRKIYTKILKRYFKNFKLKFANSVKTPLLQVADFYAGYKRESMSKNI